MKIKNDLANGKDEVFFFYQRALLGSRNFSHNSQPAVPIRPFVNLMLSHGAEFCIGCALGTTCQCAHQFRLSNAVF